MMYIELSTPADIFTRAQCVGGLQYLVHAINERLTNNLVILQALSNLRIRRFDEVPILPQHQLDLQVHHGLGQASISCVALLRGT